MQESQDGHGNVEGTHNKSYGNEELMEGVTQLVHKSEHSEGHIILGTPFTMMKIEGKWMLTVGNQRVSEPKEDWRETFKDGEMTWPMVTNVIVAIVNTEFKLKEQEKQEKPQ